MSASSLFVVPEKKPAAAFRLFCFPFAGGDITTYLPWLPLLDPDIEMVIVQLPGRGRRSHEKPFFQMDLLVDELFGAMLARLDKPFAFFGHSMGSKIAYELAKRLQQNRFPAPVHFFASGSGSPCVPRRAAPIHRLSNAAFVERISKLCGVPQAVLDNAELMQFLLPMLRADFKLVETYAGKSDFRIQSKITMLGGVEDALVSSDDLGKWSALFEDSGSLILYEGGHFFINQCAGDIVEMINATLFNESARQCA